MADSAVPITAGSGTNIDTRTEATNGNHRQVIVIGDPATNAGVAPVDATNGLSVTLTTALPAGTNAFGKLAANSGVDIGDVDVTTCGTITPGTGATNLGKAVDTAAGSTDTGVAGLVVRDDALTTLTPADGDYTNERVNARGATWVAIENGSGGQLTSFGGTSIADDAAFTVGTTSITPVGGTYKSTRDSVDDNDAGAFAMTAKRGLYTVIETPNGDSAMDETNDAVRVNIVAGAGSGGTAMTDDAAFTVGSTSFTPAGGTYKSTRDAVDDNDGGAFAMTSRRALYSALETPNGDSLADDTNDCLKTSVTQPLPAGTNNIGDVDVLTLPSLPAGTNNIGDVDVLTLPSLPAGNNNIGDVDVASLPALASGTNLIGKVVTGDDTSTLYNGTTALTPKWAPVAASSSGNNTLVASVSSKKIRVISAYLSCNGAVNAKFQSGAGGTDLTGLLYGTQYSGIVLPYNPTGWFETAATTLLNLSLSAAVAVGGVVEYVEV